MSEPIRETLARLIDPHFRLRSSSPESAMRDNLALAKADRVIAALPALLTRDDVVEAACAKWFWDWNSDPEVDRDRTLNMRDRHREEMRAAILAAISAAGAGADE